MMVDSVAAMLTSSATNNTICQGDEITFTATGGTLYEFFINDMSKQNGTAAAFTANGLSNGDKVTVKVTNAAGCSAISAAITMKVSTFPMTSAFTEHTIDGDFDGARSVYATDVDGDGESQMESGFGSDFGNVRIHTDSTAVQMNQELGAHAFTNGSDIYFNQGKYQPNSKDGQHLLAHELTHTVQQGASGMVQNKSKKSNFSGFSNHIQQVEQSNQFAQRTISEFYQTGDVNPIQQFNPLDALGSLVDISEYLNLDLPDNPIEALEMLISAMENPKVKPVLSLVPGFPLALITLKSVLATIKAIEYILENKDQIIQEMMDYIDQNLDKVQDLVREQLEGLLGLLDDRHFSIIWNVHICCQCWFI
jgi:hypothetical protein